MLVHLSVCAMHQLHRAVVPALQFMDSLNDLFRAANVFVQHSYWSALLDRVSKVVDKHLVVVHHAHQDPHHRRMLEQLLRMTLCRDLSDELCAPRVRRLKDELLERLVGDITSRVIRYACPAEGCSGGDECRKLAAHHFVYLVIQILFNRKVVTPSASRWWKFAPLCRHVLLGIALHGIFCGAAPEVYKGGWALIFFSEASCRIDRIYPYVDSPR